MTIQTHAGRGALRRLLATIALSLRALNQIEFGAPWREERRGRC